MDKKKAAKKVNNKKELRTVIKGKLETALADFKTSISGKQFDAALKKGSKLLSGFLTPKKVKEKKKKEKPPEESTNDTGQ